MGAALLRDAEGGRVDDVDACLAGDAARRIARRTGRVARLYDRGPCRGTEPIQQGTAIGAGAHRAAAAGLVGDLLGLPLPAGTALGGAERLCRARLLRGAGEGLAAIVAAHRACAAAGMRSGAVIDGATLDAQCGSWAQIDAGGGAGAALDRLVAAADAACSGADRAATLPGLDAACHATPAALAACAAARIRCGACEAFRTADAQQLDCDLFDDGAGNGSCPPGAVGRRSCGADLDVFMMNSALPLPLHTTATLALDCDPASDGRAACTCALPEVAPLVVPAIGDLCLVGVPSCPTGVLDCGTGTPLDTRLVVDHSVGTCDGAEQCRSLCDAACSAQGDSYTRLGSTCEGYCLGGANEGAACTTTSECPGGDCPGVPSASHAGLCNCTCADGRGGAPQQGLACAVGVQFVADLPADGRCDDTVVERYPPLCLPLITGESSGQLLHADNMQYSIPYTGGDQVVAGTPLACEALAGGSLSGLALVGQFTLLDTTLGDNLGRLTATCR